MSFWRTFYHLVWATKNRLPLITPQLESSLYAFLVHQAAEQGVYTYAINSWNDHVHMVVAIPPDVSVADVVKQLKGASSHNINQANPEQSFAWQRGYGVLTIGQRQRASAVAYVDQQKEHHGAATTVAALEMSSEGKEGPADPGDHRQRPPAVHDERVPYGVEDEDAPL